jgi:hypothetical protein
MWAISSVRTSGNRPQEGPAAKVVPVLRVLRIR